MNTVSNKANITRYIVVEGVDKLVNIFYNLYTSQIIKIYFVEEDYTIYPVEDGTYQPILEQCLKHIFEEND